MPVLLTSTIFIRQLKKKCQRSVSGTWMSKIVLIQKCSGTNPLGSRNYNMYMHNDTTNGATVLSLLHEISCLYVYEDSFIHILIIILKTDRVSIDTTQTLAYY